MARSPIPLRPKDLTPEMMVHHLLEHPFALSESKKIVILLMNDDEDIDIWTSSLKKSDYALMALKLMDLAMLHVSDNIEYVED
jgi:hypothetical protein